MTDKVQKNQIADILLDFYDEYDSNVINRPMIPNIYAGKILDSLQEEPVSIWHDASEKPNIKDKGSVFVITSLNGEYIGSRYYNRNDITINFGNYDKWAYLNDLLNLDNSCNFGKDLQEAAKFYADTHTEWFDADGNPHVSPAFKAGAKWQKEKDNEEKVLVYKHGFEDCKEQMMTKVIDARCFGFQGAALFSFRLPADNYLVGSEVKIIVVKED